MPGGDKLHYLLIIILGGPINYKNGIICSKTKLVAVSIKGKLINITFDILLLGKDKAVLGIF